MVGGVQFLPVRNMEASVKADYAKKANVEVANLSDDDTVIVQAGTVKGIGTLKAEFQGDQAKLEAAAAVDPVSVLANN